MNKPGLFAHAANFAPGFLQHGRRTWIGLGIGLLVFAALLIWAALALIGWLWGQTQSLAGVAPGALQGTARGVLEQVKVFVPGAQGMLDQVKERAPAARDLLAGMVPPALKPQTALPRDVSGDDLGPLARYPGLLRSQWQRSGEQTAVEYEGRADYAKLLDYYAQGFAAQGFVRSVQSATPEAESHDYVKGSERFILKVAKKPGSLVLVRIETAQP